MDADLKAKWVKALRSRKYKQGKEMLHDPDTDRYCCLGVLCEIAGRDLGADSYEWLNDVTGDFPVFVQMNDDQGYSFRMIAKFIEESL